MRRVWERVDGREGRDMDRGGEETLGAQRRREGEGGDSRGKVRKI